MESDAITDWMCLPYYQQVCIGPDAIAHSLTHHSIFQITQKKYMFRVKNINSHKIYIDRCSFRVVSHCRREHRVSAREETSSYIVYLFVDVQWFSVHMLGERDKAIP